MVHEQGILYLPLVLDMGLEEVEAVAEHDGRGDCDLGQLENAAYIAHERAIYSPDPILLVLRHPMLPRRRPCLDLLLGQIP